MGRQEEAEVEFGKALELNPGLPLVHEWLGLIYLARGRAQDALNEIEQEPMAIWLL
jgi:Flp pilus assembly protein TadD